ncbi:hypothetical protein DFH29DRAFT_996514 [Suillus ampliporus]|nr:hypothetical protein DFH29DRAFT_996514 [Suillus ampliporus]
MAPSKATIPRKSIPSRDQSSTNGLSTRQSPGTPLSQEEIEAIPSTVKNIETAEKFLTKSLLCISEEPFTLTHITSILLQITQMHNSTPLPVVLAIRAVAFILKQHVASEVANEVAQQITDSLTPRLVNNIVAAIAPQIAKILSASELMSESLTQAETIRKALNHDRNESEESLQISADRLEAAADELQSSTTDCQNAP